MTLPNMASFLVDENLVNIILHKVYISDLDVWGLDGACSLKEPDLPEPESKFDWE